jgi:hypothetical protein
LGEFLVVSSVLGNSVSTELCLNNVCTHFRLKPDRSAGRCRLLSGDVTSTEALVKMPPKPHDDRVRFAEPMEALRSARRVTIEWGANRVFGRRLGLGLGRATSGRACGKQSRRVIAGAERIASLGVTRRPPSDQTAQVGKLSMTHFPIAPTDRGTLRMEWRTSSYRRKVTVAQIVRRTRFEAAPL